MLRSLRGRSGRRRCCGSIGASLFQNVVPDGIQDAEGKSKPETKNPAEVPH
jgi:hypothetical protein